MPNLAQVNVARMRAPLDSAQMAGFVAGLEPVNALAEAAPGFVWRLQDEAGNATGLRPYNDDMIIVNLSVWTDPEALRAFTYSGEHLAFMRRRRAWFERFESVYYALWWVPVGYEPTPAEARERLEYLDARGQTPHAFHFAHPFDPPPDLCLPALA